MLHKLLRVKLQYKIAFVILLLAIVWISSGVLKKYNQQKEEGVVIHDNSPNIKVVESNAQDRVVYLSLTGEVEAFRYVNIVPEVAGKVSDVLVKDGEYVTEGNILVKIEKYEKEEQLKQTKALLKQRELEYKASQSLNEHGYRSEINDALSFAALESARADVKKAQISLESTEIKAPFSGFVDKVNVQVGELVSASSGLSVLQLVNFDKIRVVTYVPEKYLSKLKLGDVCKVLIAKNEEVDAPIVFISKIINRSTRTYRIEMVLDNNDLKIFTQGAVYSVKVPIGSYRAHRISPSALDLQDDGDLGIKVIVDKRVKFIPVEVIDSEDNGDVWVANSPDTIQLITLGHEYVKDNAYIGIR
ncbi:efflux transporter, RND family, MFP subunit [Ehrlichia chaffeensis str. Heartland]|uniref:Efflux transporter, RND family, MFP subunit n=1 Tax=Ehrlichia chaffeensis (strain ATCC CRL-10679 / Arkansas) TaxID=205920 RepID=Q2GGV8_EHRCR|nr:efflux RND transporter periplasmic adaptor subunit [Ehrlichia chaffeensis]ABD44718.1 efflux transporter, RND family, MFP subunit [Ehrlichia chaffeensis str. Arkansas]AHX03605.1 efflux transporter, RND family, MFP subunit [Ehrlichia chaffeensis str. Heartland]AHX05673.1 efflux transporter, RND family, MFP subunit [Ehrlichia chaffeensis str. Jax]AHX06664.1 efflux transporter, RND family, MFP subunit [Ehrlichia chaffeensis str. Liberty]AHX07414.1 efflux transporter, RND family, MFP subunit [Eh